MCNNQTECLILDEFMKRACYIASQVTTCWKVYRKEDIFKIPLVIKDLWQYLEHKEEGKLLREAVEKEIVNIARYYYHKTVHIGE